MSSVLSLLTELHDRSESVNIAMPLVLARYHSALVFIGILGVAAGILVFRHYKDSERERVKFFAKGISLICIFVLQAGAIGWFITPLYDFVLKTAAR